MQKVQCARCNEDMTPLWQSDTYGHPTFRYHCHKCYGIANVQVNGSKARQITLDGNHNEYRPQSVQPHDEKVELEHPSAFQIGVRLTPLQQAAQAAVYARQQVVPPQAQASALAAAQAAAAQSQARVLAYQQYMAYARAAQARGLAPPLPVQQPVAYTLGQHARPVQPMSPAELRRRLMGR